MRRDLRKWLEEIGLGEHAAAFAENGVDFALLPELTNEDLKDLGITRLADRKRFFKAIVDLGLTKPPSPATTPEPERRQLTVMFCDLVDFTALSGILDPELLRDVLRAYRFACAGIIDRYDGHIAQYFGDGLMVYFGIPRAHEDDAQRAVSAGLRIVDAVAELSRRLHPKIGIALRVRIGIHTGLVVAGEMGSGAAREEFAIVGETPNVAARVEALAAPNSVSISASTRRLVGSLFTYEDMGIRQLKGVARPIQVWRVTGEQPAGSRFEALHPTGLSPLVGRQAEMEELLRRWEQAKHGESQIVLLTGEPGIGKSRLVEALRERIGGAQHAEFRHQCSPYFTDSALYPFVRELEQAAGLSPTDPPESQLDKLERLLAEPGESSPEALSLMARLLSIPADPRCPTLDLPPQRLREKTLTVLIDRIIRRAARRPVLLVVEDAHWIDPSSEELISVAIDRLRNSSALVVITYRPEYAPRWGVGTAPTVLTLNRLSGTEAAALVGALSGASPLPAQVADQIVAKSDGVPLFVEELTKTMLESSAPAGPSQPSVPATLHDTLMARLERTAAMKEIAQTAAVLGREFSEALLAEVSSLQGEMLTKTLDELVQAGLLFRGTTPHGSYLFKHALVRDAAYETLLLSNRQKLHASTALALERRFPEVAEGRPELLGHHYEAAGMPDRAIDCWRRAGVWARDRSNYIEAEHHLARALGLVAVLPDDRRPGAELDLQIALAGVYRAVRGTGALATEQAYARARALCEQIGATDRLLEVVYGQFICVYNRPKLHDAERYAMEFMEIAQRTRNNAALAVGYQILGGTVLLLGDFVRARHLLEQSLDLRYADETLLNLYSHGQYPAFALMAWAWTMFALGFPDQAHIRAKEAVVASKARSAFLYAMALGNDCYLHHFCGDYAAVEENVATLLELAAEKGIVVFREVARVYQGWTRAYRSATEEGIELMRDALAKLDATEQKVEQPYTISILAETYLRAGRYREAQEELHEALRLVEITGERWYEAELRRLTGDVALAQGETARAEAHFARAFAVAKSQSANMWMLRAAMRLARLWRETGRAAEARALLAPILDGFTEGFGMADLTDGKALLDDLGVPTPRST